MSSAAEIRAQRRRRRVLDNPERRINAILGHDDDPIAPNEETPSTSSSTTTSTPVSSSPAAPSSTAASSSTVKPSSMAVPSPPASTTSTSSSLPSFRFSDVFHTTRFRAGFIFVGAFCRLLLPTAETETTLWTLATTFAWTFASFSAFAKLFGLYSAENANNIESSSTSYVSLALQLCGLRAETIRAASLVFSMLKAAFNAFGIFIFSYVVVDIVTSNTSANFL